ncbi:hypothetical protein ACP70R_046589 [Stipagrostis hirtigluma subsp. patula]
MVFYALFVGAELDGLTNLQPRRGCDDPSFQYYFKLRCENCGETTAKATCVALGEVVDLPTGRGTANLVQKCKLCGRDGTIVMIPGQGTPLTIEQSQKGEKTCLMVFDCRGYEPFDFEFRDGWKAESGFWNGLSETASRWEKPDKPLFLASPASAYPMGPHRISQKKWLIRLLPPRSRFG